MARLAAVAATFLALSPVRAQLLVAQILDRVSEEAEILQQNAPKVVTQESLEQRSLMPPSRFRPRAGTHAAEAPALRLRVREVVSEYSYGALRQADSKSLIEFRQVISIDGRAVQSAETARRALAATVQTPDDRSRKRMIEDFAKNGLVDIATDYGLILLVFTRRGMEDVRVTPIGSAWVGTEPALTFAWQQKSAAGGALEFHGRESVHRALQGTLWVRAADGLPLRIYATIEHVDASKHLTRDDATVEYLQSAHGFVTPASIIHRHMVDGEIVTENLYRYEPFKLFSTSTEIKFTDLPDVKAPVKK